MIDEVAIQQTLNRYSEGASRADWNEVVATFVPDGIWEIASSGAKFQGRATIQETQMRFTAPMEYMFQMNAPGVIKVDGDTATARSAIREVGKFAGRDEAFEAVGFYADKLIRTPDGWKFTHRVFELRGKHRYQLMPA